MKVIYDESILKELDEMGYSIGEHTNKYLLLRSEKAHRFIKDIECIEKLLGVEYVEFNKHLTLWRKLKLDESNL